MLTKLAPALFYGWVTECRYFTHRAPRTVHSAVYYDDSQGWFTRGGSIGQRTEIPKCWFIPGCGQCDDDSSFGQKSTNVFIYLFVFERLVSKTALFTRNSTGLRRYRRTKKEPNDGGNACV